MGQYGGGWGIIACAMLDVPFYGLFLELAFRSEDVPFHTEMSLQREVAT